MMPPLAVGYPRRNMYYVLVKAGVPVDVVTQMAMAKQRARELSTVGSECTIVPVVPKEKAPEVSPESPKAYEYG